MANSHVHLLDRRRGFRCLLAATAIIRALSLGAAVRAADPPPDYKTLTSALADAKPSDDGGVAICIDGEHTRLPKDADGSDTSAPLRPGAPVVRIGHAFGRLVKRFGSVTAIAPPTMVLINTNPEKPNIYDGMPPEDVLPLLLASLSNGQWQAVTSDAGLPVSELGTNDQRMLMAALLPHGKLTVEPIPIPGVPYVPVPVVDSTPELSQSSLRIGTTFSMAIPSRLRAGSYNGNTEIVPPTGGPQRLRITSRGAYGASQDELYGVTVRETVPTQEKISQLPIDDPRLTTQVRLAGIETVDELIVQITKSTGVEIYTDPRYAKLSLTWMGDAGASASAHDLLRAISLCCTGTYRRVGPLAETHPAYVLTDDLVGMGTRQSRWFEFQRDGDAARQGPVDAASESLYSRFGPRSVPAFGANVSLVDSSPASAPNASPMNAFVDTWTAKPFSQLTPEQKSAVQRTVAMVNTNNKNDDAVATGTIMIFPMVKVEMLVPGIEGPLDLNLTVPKVSLFKLPKDAAAQVEALRLADGEKQTQEYDAAHPELKRTPAPAAARAQMIAMNPRRAVIVSPSTFAELTEDIAAMQKLELNELWLDLPFRRRPPALPEQPAPPGGSATQSPTADNLLAAALHETEKIGIRVYPIVDVFAEDPPPAPPVTASKAVQDAARDRNLLGETSREAEQHVQDRRALVLFSSPSGGYSYGPARAIPAVYRNPLADDVLEDDKALIGRLVAVPGVAGIVWKNTDPPGYELIAQNDGLRRSLLGYNDKMRLAFLRRFHADPIDVYTTNSMESLADTEVPIQHRAGSETDEVLRQWKIFRREQNIAFLQALRPAAGAVPIFVHQRREGEQVGYFDGLGYLPGWYGSWSSADAALPTIRGAYDDRDLAPAGAPFTPTEEGSAQIQAHKQSASVMNVASVSGFLFMRTYILPTNPQAPKAADSPDNGFVLDFDEPNHASPEELAKGIPRTLTALAATGR